MTINARSRLFGRLRSFVEWNLRGFLTWNDVTPAPGVPSDRGPHGRRNPHGKMKEIATIRFGDYDLTAESPLENGPLGWITLTADGQVAVEGPMDQTVWDQVGEYIKTRGIKEIDHGRRSPSADSGWLPAR